MAELSSFVCFTWTMLEPLLTQARSFGHLAALETMLLVATEAQAISKDTAVLEGVTKHVLVDGFVADGDAKLETKPTADLLRAPAELQLLFDQRLKLTRDFSRLLALHNSALLHESVRYAGVVGKLQVVGVVVAG